MLRTAELLKNIFCGGEDNSLIICEIHKKVVPLHSEISSVNSFWSQDCFLRYLLTLIFP